MSKRCLSIIILKYLVVSASFTGYDIHINNFNPFDIWSIAAMYVVSFLIGIER